MIGLNGGLMGVRKVPTISSASGLWVPNEQVLAQRAGIWPTVDPNFANVSLLLHMDGTNGSTTFTDNSANTFTVTATGNAKLSTAQKKFGATSGLFDGSGDWITAPSVSAFSFGTGDFTVEAWIYRVSVNLYSALLEIGNHANADSIIFLVGTNGITAYSGGFLGSGTLATGQWQHVAWTRSSGTLRTFVDGTLTSTTSFSGNLSSNSNVSIGYGAGLNGGSTYYFNGYIDDLRITKGISRYNATFTPPTAAFPDS
jgi:hypothetical protein